MTPGRRWHDGSMVTHGDKQALGGGSASRRLASIIRPPRGIGAREPRWRQGKLVPEYTAAIDALDAQGPLVIRSISRTLCSIVALCSTVSDWLR